MRHDVPIRLATLGSDAATEQLIAAAERSPRFQLVAQFDGRTDAQRRSSPTAVPPPDNDWEALWTDDLADLVAVASRPDTSAEVDRRMEQLKRLVQTGRPLILVHPACDMLQAYELEMNRGDGGGPLYPYSPVADHPVIRALVTAARSPSADWGPLEQIVWERFADVDQRSRQAVLTHVARDTLVLRRLLSDISSVSATGVASDSADWGNLGVNLTGPNGPIARWTLGPRRDAVGARLSLVGVAKTISAWIPEDGGPIELSETLSDAPRDLSEFDAAAEFLARVEAALMGSTAWAGTTWEELCRALEVTDAVERSVRRRRTIELYHEQVTEHETFKSMMAAGGCGLLLWVLLLLLMAGVVEGLKLPLRDTFLWRLWPVFLFGPLVVFLALQLLQFVFPRRDQPNGA